MSMSYEEKLVRRVAKLVGGEVDVWHNNEAIGIMNTKASSLDPNSSHPWFFGPYYIEHPFVDIWQFAVHKMMTSNSACRHMNIKPSSLEELEIMLIAAGV